MAGKGGLYNPRPVDDIPVNGQLEHGVTSNWAFGHAGALDAHTVNFYERMRVGWYYLPPFGKYFIGSTTVTNGRYIVLPILVARSVTFDRLAIRVSTLEAGKMARIGVYTDNGDLYPDALVAGSDAGELNCGATGVKENIVDLTLKGLYWLVVQSNGTGTLKLYRTYHENFWILGCSPSTQNFYRYGWLLAGVYGALPATFPAGATYISATNAILGGLMRVESLN